jgi:AcrR family transcriptional regulator
MTRKRLSAADRRTEILAAARRAYAQHGLGASSLQIAAEAKVSDALIFRHFSTKAALHREVLRNLIQEQNDAYSRMGLRGHGVDGVMQMLENYFLACVSGRQDHIERVRILTANLASQGDYARLAYRRAVRRGRKALDEVMQEAAEQGFLNGPALPSANVIMFLEHLGSAAALANANGGVGAYQGTLDERVRDLVRFAARGIGVKEEGIDAYFQNAQTSVK